MTEFATNRRALIVGAGLAAAASVATAHGKESPSATESAARKFTGDWRSQKKFAKIFDLNMAYYEVGEGRPIVFLHGNPTSSYLWRNVIPHVRHLGRCIAPDLIGMGDSDKLSNPGPEIYTYETHRKYLFELLRVLGVDRNITLVVHDWGSGLGLDFASHHPDAIRAIAYMEAILRPPGSPPPDRNGGVGLFGKFQTKEGEVLVLEQNVFVEQLLIGGAGYYLRDADKEEYRRPYLQAGASRWPTLQWPRELPNFSAVTAPIVEAYTKWLAADEAIPKLFVHALPGAIFSNPDLVRYLRGFHNQTEVTVYGTHFVPEFAPDALGRALSEWLGRQD
jgi:haloalkane dehalogenase